MAESRFATVNNLRLHYLDYGNQAAPPLVCIHGLTGNAHHFDTLAQYLAPHFHMMAIDVRGRGESAWGPRDEYTLHHYVDDLMGLLDAIGVLRVSLIGTSMGGLISMIFAGEHPARAGHLVLNDIGPSVDTRGIVRIAGYVPKAPKDFRDHSELIAYHRHVYPPVAKLPDSDVLRWVGTSVMPIPGGRLGWRMDPAVRSAIVGPSALHALPDLWKIYARITASILIVRGETSDILSRETVERMIRVQPKARVIEVSGVAHAPFLNEPQVLAGMREFFGISRSAVGLRRTPPKP